MRHQHITAGQQQSGRGKCLLSFLALVGGALAIIVAIALYASASLVGNSVQTTVTGHPGGFQPALEAAYRGQDLNQFRVDYYQQQGKTDGRNLGMGEIVAQFQDKTELLLHVTPIFWGSDQAHSETQAMEDIRTYLATASMQNIQALSILIVSQYDVCVPCVQTISQVAVQLRAQLHVKVRVSIWQVKRYIDGYNPKTWIAPAGPADMELVAVV